MMEVEWIDKRMHLRRLLHEYPDWSDRQYAEKVGMSRSWVQKWRKRIKEHGRDRTQKEEAIYPRQPDTVESTQIVIDEQLGFYNYERPNQALSCRNLPPKIAHPDLPILPRLPAHVDPDAWLKAYHNHVFKRVVRSSGSVDVDKHSYYVHKRFAGQKIMLVVNAETKQFDIQTGEGYFKSRDIKGLFHGEMSFTDYVDYIIQDAKSEARRLQQKQRRYSA